MGRSFVEEDLRCYYKNFEWYTESISPEDFQWEMFNTYQKQTIENIKKVEAEREQLKQTN